MTDKKIHGLYAITDPLLIPQEQMVLRVAGAIQGGARVIQYRNKTKDQDLKIWEATDLQTLCRTLNIPFIINDDIELAIQIGADGVHLGNDDCDIKQARQLAGDNMLIGVSCYNQFKNAVDAVNQGADYIAFGRFFPSSTKPDAVQANLSLLQQAKQELSVPVVAIGGITPENGASLIEAGADALAVIHGVFGQDDITAAAARYAALFE
ncbi:MAG: thiamine phosphate synthase [Gammaproteobacteria bacterium]|nr:thiamine phosphate synthase [Gammaproteobacteria bacterium]